MFKLIRGALEKADSGPGRSPYHALVSSIAKEEKAPTVQAIKKTDDELQVVFGEVYAPGFPDSQDDWMSAETIREMAYGFMKKSALAKIDLHHTRVPCGAVIVESFIAREDDPIYIPGSWVIGVHVPDKETWGLIKSGELNGFSIDGTGHRVPGTLEFELPEVLEGLTTEADGHTHKFAVKYDGNGFAGGFTDEGPDGHWHEIVRGTSTEVVKNHSHRFSFVEVITHAQNVA